MLQLRAIGAFKRNRCSRLPSFDSFKVIKRRDLPVSSIRLYDLSNFNLRKVAIARSFIKHLAAELRAEFASTKWS